MKKTDLMKEKEIRNAFKKLNLLNEKERQRILSLAEISSEAQQEPSNQLVFGYTSKLAHKESKQKHV